MDYVNGEFHFTHRSDLPEDRSIPLGWFAISHRWFDGVIGENMSSVEERRDAHANWYRITGPESSIYRIIRFAPQLGYSGANRTGEIALDWSGRIDLLGDPKEVENANLKIRPAKWYEKPLCLLYHPDPAYRLARWPTVIAVSLGVLSVFLGMLSVFLAVYSAP